VQGTTGEDVREVKSEDVVSFHDVGIAFGNATDEFREHFFLASLATVDDAPPPCAVAQGNDDDPVTLACRVAEPVPRSCVGFNVELQTAEIGEFHPFEESPPGLHQVLRGRIGEKVQNIEVLVGGGRSDRGAVVVLQDRPHGLPQKRPFFEDAEKPEEPFPSRGCTQCFRRNPSMRARSERKKKG